jgi:hypothetical protein
MGRWKLAMTPLHSKRTRDPEPSITMAPGTSNRPSMADHSIDAETGYNGSSRFRFT